MHQPFFDMSDAAIVIQLMSGECYAKEMIGSGCISVLDVELYRMS